ncbi:iron-containing hydrogenase [Strigomonas culicis]|uniref:Iron-containing hydrogenase n=1 Tax=Strigomonas culicis TaxID=28005 RepID=S9UAQ3_9TRYP|nr:iron-containing hydrogenase [Strigomonas culicis]|eukprot:EPY25829.1 iron-containing hydrogenase [Strigomonas culicis]
MSAAFSPSLQLAGMDYIAPSAECIKPTMTTAGAATVTRHVAGAALPPEVLKITLQDCLACSGCVTTAETILITAQSREEIVRQREAHPRRPLVVSVSTQSAASLAAHYGLSHAAAYALVSGFVREVLAPPAGVPLYVTDLRWAQSVATRLTALEYRRRLREAPHTLPLIVSACPGWVCYCEKQGGALLSHVCPVLSPQGIAGSYIKRGALPDAYHVSVQPCFDRKLEAARDSFTPGAPGAAAVPYTDCVVSTAELLAWMQECIGPDAAGAPLTRWCAPLDSDLAPLLAGPAAPLALGLPADIPEAHVRSSDGYHLAAMAMAAAAGGGPLDVQYAKGRNHNLLKATAPALPQQTFCVAYGFQQIQNIVRGLTKGLSAVKGYTFIELMACPGGCLNGGGQVRAQGGGDDALQRLHACACDGSLPAEAAATAATADSPPHSVRRVEDGAEALFRAATLARVLDRAAPELWSCTFHDRQKEFEELLDKGNIHSLKW